MPAITIQLVLSKPSRDTDRVTFTPTSKLSCYAEQSITTFKNSKGRISIILSDPEQFINLKPEKVLEIVQKESRKFQIDLSEVKNYKVVYLNDDFYSLSPGSERLRPTQNTHIRGLTLAGDYTKQKYLATMEGAVVSGVLASNIVSQSFID